METHCAIARIHLDTEKQPANVRKKIMWFQPIPMQAHWITSGKGLEEFEALMAVQKEKKKQTQAKAWR